MNKSLAKAVLMSLLCSSVLHNICYAGDDCCSCEDEKVVQQSEGTTVIQSDIGNVFGRIDDLRADIIADIQSKGSIEENNVVDVNAGIQSKGGIEENNVVDANVDSQDKGDVQQNDSTEKNSSAKEKNRDIRTDPSEVGVWMRGETGETKIGTYGFNYNLMSGGYDWHKENDARILFAGVGFSYGINDCDDAVIGDAESYGVSLYGSWYGKEKNEYIDLVLRYGRLSKEYSGLDKTGMFVSGEYDKDMFSIATKYGRRIFTDGWYWEPSVGLLWGKVGSADFTDNLGTDIHADSTNSMIASLGMQVGKNIKGIEYYCKAEVMHDFDGKLRVSSPGIVAEDDMGGTWVKCAIGASRKVSEHNSFYLEVGRDFGNKVEKPYSIGLGYRFTW